MRLVLQRVSHAEVTVDGECLGKIGHGYMVLFGAEAGDTEEITRKMAEKMFKLRVFEDENGRMNRSIVDTEGELLVISQFTLYADCRKGNRPNFLCAGKPEQAEKLYEYFLSYCQTLGIVPQKGKFGADMKVELLNDGPVTIILDSEEIIKK